MMDQAAYLYTVDEKSNMISTGITVASRLDRDAVFKYLSLVNTAV